MKWMKADGAILDREGEYLVKTNGMEWRDPDLKVMRGSMVQFFMRPDYVRGRPVWVARITDPEQQEADIAMSDV